MLHNVAQAGEVQNKISSVKNSMLTWHAPSPQVRICGCVQGLGQPCDTSHMMVSPSFKGSRLVSSAGAIHSAIFLRPARLRLQAVERLVEKHLVRQRSVDAPSAAEELKERELVAWFGRCGRYLLFMDCCCEQCGAAARGCFECVRC